MSLLFVIYLYYICIVNTPCSTGPLTVLPRNKVKREVEQSSTPFVFLFNKARRKFSSNLDLDIPEFQSVKTDILLSDEEITDEVPHVIVKIKTSEKSKTTDEPVINMTNYLIDDQEKTNTKSKVSQVSSKQGSKSAIRILNLTNTMFDYNAQKIYHTVNGIRQRLSKEHDQRIVLQMVQKQVENGIKELKAIKEKCDKDYSVFSEQKKTAMEKLLGLREVMKEKKKLDETLATLLDHAVAFNIEELGPEIIAQFLP